MTGRLTATVAIFLSPLALHCSQASAQCTLNVQGDIKSGWNKQSVSYGVESNTLKIKVGDVSKDDADSIFIGSIKGCRTLTIDAPQISGNYPWGGKAIGFSFFNDKLEPHQWGNQASFPNPRGRTIDDGFALFGPVSNTKIVYDIPNSAGTTYIGAKLFIGRNNTMELQFSAQEAPREAQASAAAPRRAPQSSARPSPRFPQGYIASAGHEPDDPAMSCALNCHAPRDEHGPSIYAREARMPLPDACRGGRD